MIRIGLKLDCRLNKDLAPLALHVFFSKDISMPVHIVPNAISHIELVGHAPRIRSDAIVGIDCICTADNVRLGFDSIFIERLVPGQALRCTLHNANSAALHAGHVIVTCLTKQTPETYTPIRSIASIPIAQSFGEYIQAAYKPFRDGTLSPSCSKVARIHAPMFTARACTLPGVCFWMTSWEGFSEKYLEHIGGITEKRLGVDMHAMSMAQVPAFLAELVGAFPSSCRYVSDFYKKGGRMYPFESFDDLFSRQCGDCEDFSKASCHIFDHIRNGVWTSPFARKLQHVAKKYVACSILGMVSKPSYSGHASGSDWAAHMFVNLIPKGRLGKWAGLDLGAVDPSLRVYCCEGTGHVSVDLIANGGHADEYVQLSDTLDTVAYPGVENSFYRKNVHLFTNTLFKDGINHGHFTFMKGGKYGVPFEDVYMQRDTVSLYKHPGFTDNAHADIKSVMLHEHPSPTLNIPVRAVGTGVDFMGAREECSITGTRVKDFFTHTDMLAPRDKSIIEAFVARHETCRVDDIREDFTPGHACRRIRVYYK
jgi:hypothetical protein